jgi:3-hydroxyisobutyrate dehydrogenase
MSEHNVVVGFVGLGTMGSRMAGNLQKAGFKLVVHDLHRQAASHHLDAGARWADNARALAGAADVIFSSLPEPRDVETVALGADGLIAGIKPGAAWFDLSTNSPSVVRALHAAFTEKGAHMLDAPVSGGPAGAASRKLAIWVGGDKAVFDRHKAVLDAIGDQAAYIGPIGSATVAKLVHNMSSYALVCALAETFTMGVKAGVEPLALWQAVRQGAAGRRFTFDGLIDQFLPGTYDPPAFALKLAHKDVALATALGRELGLPMRMCNLALAEMTEALARGWGGRDSRAVMLLQQERAGVEIAVDAERLREARAPAGAQDDAKPA